MVAQGKRNISPGRLLFTGIFGWIFAAGTLCALAVSSADGGDQEGFPSYNREVRPILSKACFRCHGMDPKQRKAKLRLDVREEALSKEAFVPEKPEESEIIFRIVSADEDEVMPPPDAGDPLTSEEIAILKKWIKGGAKYEGHWAFEPPVKRALPLPDSGLRPIDQWVQSLLSEKGHTLAVPASRETWLRRVTFDLTGLPPTLEEIEDFLADTSVNAREKVVERLLNTAEYGERMALDWLDLARYADTYGRHEDADSSTWPYRDWVIQAFEENLPYDQFVLWQTAGDMLPDPTRDQMVATCFNRLPQQSNEAGSNPEEFRMEQVSDRVHTNATTFLGLTMECARCHDHKYDPLTQKDYYSMAAFFNNIDELGLFAVYTGGVPTPSVVLYDPEQKRRLAEIHQELDRLSASLESMRPGAEARFREWLKKHSPPVQRPEPGFWGKVGAFFTADPPPVVEPVKPLVWLKFEDYGDDKIFANEASADLPAQLHRKTKLKSGPVGNAIHWVDDNYVTIQNFREFKRSETFSMAVWLKPLEKFDHAAIAHRCVSGIDAAWRGFRLDIDDGRPLFALGHFSPGNEICIRGPKELPIGEWTHVAVSYDGSSQASGMKLYLDGQRVKDPEIIRDQLYKDIVYREEWGDEGGKDAVRLDLMLAGRHNDASYRNGLMDEFYFYDRELTAPEISQLALLPDSSEPEDWFDWYLREEDESWKEITSAIAALREEENRLSGEPVEVMVMKEWEGPRRETHILNRGKFDEPGEEVRPDTPASLPAFPEDLPRNRLGFAAWLISPENPLTARVEANRLWQHFFGRGLVGTSEDFGTQGEYPLYQDLLDWMAVHFREDLGWDVKALCREIVLSDTYGQSAVSADPELMKNDPENRLLARGPRSRLPAEALRDMALSVSGLLDRRVGGPSVKPYQPAGLWEESGTQHVYIQDHGENLYRRSLYTFWRRTLPPPSMIVFDAPTREFCTARRTQTTTPLQGLVLMNDPQFLEAARVLAENLVREYPDAPAARAMDAFRRLTSQTPTEEQVTLLSGYLASEAEIWEKDADSTQDFLKSSGELPLDENLPAVDVAATTEMVRLLFGFSETVVKP